MSDRPPDGVARAQVPASFLDLSLGGALLNLGTSLQVGAIHDFALDLGGEIVSVQAEVRHCQRASQGPGYEVGVQFVGVAPGDQRRLGDYLGARPGGARPGTR